MKLSPEAKIVEIEGCGWKFTLTPEEFEAWDVYADNHPLLLGWSYEQTLKMFLFNLRNCETNLNQPLNK